MRTWITRLVVTIAAGGLLAGAIAGGAGATASTKSPAAHRSHTAKKANKARKAAAPRKAQVTSDDGRPSVSDSGCEPGDDLSSSKPDVYGSGGDAPAPPTSCD